MTNERADNERMGDQTGEAALNHDKPQTHFKEALFLAGISGMAILCGFGMTLTRTKRRNPASFVKGMFPEPGSDIAESGASLASRALAWGSLYAVVGVGTLTFVVSRILGINSMRDLRENFKIRTPDQSQKNLEPTSVTLAKLFDESNSQESKS